MIYNKVNKPYKNNNLTFNKLCYLYFYIKMYVYILANHMV